MQKFPIFGTLDESGEHAAHEEGLVSRKTSDEKVTGVTSGCSSKNSDQNPSSDRGENGENVNFGTFGAKMVHGAPLRQQFDEKRKDLSSPKFDAESKNDDRKAARAKLVAEIQYLYHQYVAKKAKSTSGAPVAHSKNYSNVSES